MKTKNQLRVNGLSTTMYFLTYFIVLMTIMAMTCALLVVIMVLFDIPALRDWPAILVFSVLILIYCPSSILSCTCISYIFDKTDSAQSILPNIATLVGWIPFVFVVLLDVMNIGKYPYPVSLSQLQLANFVKNSTLLMLKPLIKKYFCIFFYVLD